MSIHENNIIPLDSQTTLRPGQRVVKIGNYYFPVGVNERSETMTFYKCASVNSDNKTWSGYKAILVASSYYYFEDTITENLQYSGNVLEVGAIYNSDGLVKIADLFDGLIKNDEDQNFTIAVANDSVVNEEQNLLVLTRGSVSQDGVLDLNK